jgi:hypothetical protein
VLAALRVGELNLVSWGEWAPALTDHARQSSRAPACRSRVRDGRPPDGALQGDSGELHGTPQGDGSELDTGERMVKIAG